MYADREKRTCSCASEGPPRPEADQPRSANSGPVLDAHAILESSEHLPTAENSRPRGPDLGGRDNPWRARRRAPVLTSAYRIVATVRPARRPGRLVEIDHSSIVCGSFCPRRRSRSEHRGGRSSSVEPPLAARMFGVAPMADMASTARLTTGRLSFMRNG